MAIWMDMTNSLHDWQGGIVGIVRAELEIAKNMHQYNPDLRFVKYDGKAFIEIKPEEISWLWDCGAIGDAYMKAMGRKQSTSVLTNDKEADNGEEKQVIPLNPKLQYALSADPAAYKRFLFGCKSLGEIMPAPVRGIMKYGYRLVLKWPLKGARAVFRACKSIGRGTGKSVVPSIMTSAVRHPFRDDDVVFSCGWTHSGKEGAFTQIKTVLSHLHIIYLIYDIIVLAKDTRQFYDDAEHQSFGKYLKWASFNCDALLYGGETAMKDTAAFQAKNEWPVPPGYPVRFGSNILQTGTDPSGKAAHKYMKQLGITRDYIIAIGTLDKRKNYGTLYRAYTMMADKKENYPQLVIVGKDWTLPDLSATIKEDPRTNKDILFATPTDDELNILYTNAKFSILPSAYEGWSLTLPEALGYHKFVLASDVPPLREIGRDLIEYCDTYDPKVWAERIVHYANSPQELARREAVIRKEWKPISWNDCGRQIDGYLRQLSDELTGKQLPTLYFDVGLTTITAATGGKITGILRTELMLLKGIYGRYPNLELFALHPNSGKYVRFTFEDLETVITGSDLSNDFEALRPVAARILFPNMFISFSKHDYYSQAAWFFVSCLPKRWRESISEKRAKRSTGVADEENSTNPTQVSGLPFKKGDVVFTAGSGINGSLYRSFLDAKKRIGFKFSPIVYDFTPIVTPQVQSAMTKLNYPPFLKFVSNTADLIMYGGRTAQKDGISYQRKNNLPIPASEPVFFGSNPFKRTEKPDPDYDADLLRAMGINRPFVLAVGTIEPRKNYETLYRAYVRMLKKYGEDNIPMLAICGHPGWRSEEFLSTFQQDERIRHNMIRLEPGDIQLDCLYRHCEFTVLASLYEGWSLTLPESMYYGKLCLCCDTPALVEAAGDMAEYVDAFDEQAWCDRIYHFHASEEARKAYETRIQNEWHAITWQECATQVLDNLKTLLIPENND